MSVHDFGSSVQQAPMCVFVRKTAADSFLPSLASGDQADLAAGAPKPTSGSLKPILGTFITCHRSGNVKHTHWISS